VEVVSYKIGVCKVSAAHGKECRTEFERLSYNGRSSVVLCRPFTGRMHQIRVHLQYLGFPVINDPLYNHVVFGPDKGKGGVIGKSDDQLIQDLISIHNAENWLGMDGDSELSMFNNNNENGGGNGSKKGKDGRGGHHHRHGGEDAVNGGAFRPPSSSSGSTPSPTSASPSSSTSSTAAATSSAAGNSVWAFDPQNPSASLENNPNVPKNCTITRPPPITKPTREPVVLREPLEGMEDIDGEGAGGGGGEGDEDDARRYRYRPDKMTWDPHCYECKVRYRDPKPGDLVMYLHAWRYKVSDCILNHSTPITFS